MTGVAGAFTLIQRGGFSVQRGFQKWQQPAAIPGGAPLFLGLKAGRIDDFIVGRKRLLPFPEPVMGRSDAALTVESAGGRLLALQALVVCQGFTCFSVAELQVGSEQFDFR